MGHALYRKYRPKSLADVVGQEHITTTLSHALKQGKLAHAYLFTGPRGTGKTSIARILAHEINGLPYTDDTMHLDIIEIDAASNRRIDEIRELRDKVNTAPSSAPYKVYIIDEVHMLTREAFNALLKTLEEPPAHVVFILATTEAHKLPETIVSRTQRFMFRPVDQPKVIAHLRTIADREGLQVEDEALALVAGYGGGSFRDSISLLDQTRGQDGTVDASFVRLLIGMPPEKAIRELQHAVAQHDAAELSRLLAGLQNQGFAAGQIAQQLGRHLRGMLVDPKANPGADASYFQLLQKLLDVPSAHDPDNYLLLILLEQALASQLPAAPAQPVRAAAAAPTRATTKAAVPRQSAAAPIAPPAAPAPSLATPLAGPEQAEKEHTQPQASGTTAAADPEPSAPPQDQPASAPPGPSAEPIAVDAQTWPAILTALKRTHNTLYGIARMGRPVFTADDLTIYFGFAFHKRRLSEAKNQDVLANIVREVMGRPMGIHCELEPKAGDKPSSTTTPDAAPAPVTPATLPSDSQPPSQALSAISNVFGGGEVLDS